MPNSLLIVITSFFVYYKLENMVNDVFVFVNKVLSFNFSKIIFLLFKNEDPNQTSSLEYKIIQKLHSTFL